ncbi:MAG: NADH-quinone oxidoreductase subunit M, partial [Helicobacter sp.]|nr:NADH-quinone oxidoreductase subunit M [Helicobacter sp.]
MEHLVSLLIFFPALAALFALALQSNFRAYGIVISLLELVLSLWLFASFDSTQGSVQCIEAYALVPSMGITYLVGVDGISLALVLLSTFMMFVGFVWLPKHTQTKELVVCLLLLETILVGIFCVFDAILFYMFWELSLLPLVYMLGIWGGKQKIYAAMKFFIYVFAASMIMLIGILYVGYQYYVASGYWSFSLLDWENLSLGIATQSWLFW